MIDGLLIFLHFKISVIRRAIGPSKINVNVRITGGKLRDFHVLFDRFFGKPLLKIKKAQMIMGPGEIGIELNGFFPGIETFDPHAPLLINRGQVGVGFGKAGVERNRFLGKLQRAVKIPRVKFRAAPGFIGLCKLRIFVDRFFKKSGGGLPFFFLKKIQPFAEIFFSEGDGSFGGGLAFSGLEGKRKEEK